MRLRDRGWPMALMVPLMAGLAHAGVLETLDPDASILLGPSPTPGAFADGVSDFSLMCWIRRADWSPGQYSGVLNANGVLEVGFDDEADGIRVALRGTVEDVEVLVPLRDGSPEEKVPVEQWMLIACSWDAAQSELTAWAQSELVPRADDTSSVASWSGDTPWPFTVGAAGGAPCFTGQLGLVVLRDHQIDGTDFDLLWNGGVAHYSRAVKLQAGSFDGVDGIEWMIGHGVITHPDTIIHSTAAGAELGSTLNADRLIVYNAGDDSDFLTGGLVDAVTGTWTLHSPLDVAEPFGGFFVREIPDIGLEGDRYVSAYSPKARQLAFNAPQGLIRVIASASSRATRYYAPFYGGGWENWALGGVYQTRKNNVAGVVVPAWRSWGTWPFFNASARSVGDVHMSVWTPYASLAFGNFGTYGMRNATWWFYEIAGSVVVIEDGGQYIPKARPEAGTQLDAATDPVTVRVLVLKFPGSGTVTYQGEKASSQLTESVTTVGEPTLVQLDTTVLTHALATGDVVAPAQDVIMLDGIVQGIEVGYGCFVSDGAGQGGFTQVSAVDTSTGETLITFEQWFPADPVVDSSVLKFGPVDAVWVSHEWDGLSPGDPQVYRGVNLTADGGIVVALFMECFNPDADGFIVGPIGRTSRNYGDQLDRLFTQNGLLLAEKIQPDVWLQFFANNQGGTPDLMGVWTEAIRAVSPDTEIWWCGDPDLDTISENTDGADDWQHFTLEHAADFNVGAVLGLEDPRIGIGMDRLADGQLADRWHITVRGNIMYLQVIFEMMQIAALGDPLPCPGDVNDDGVVNVLDLLAVIGDWGPCGGPCPSDVTGDGVVNVLDLLAVISAWGPCPGVDR